MKTKLRKQLITIGLCLVVGQMFGQITDIQKEYFETSDPWDTLESLKILSYQDPQLAYDKALDIKNDAADNESLIIESRAWHEMAFASTFLGENERASKFAHIAYQKAKEADVRIEMLRSLNTEALALYNLDHYTEAMKCLNIAIDIAENDREDSTHLGVTYRRIANINYRSGDNELMHENLLKSYDLLKSTKDDLLLIGTVGSLAHSYRARGELEKAKPLYEDVLNKALNKGLRPHAATTYDALRQIAIDENQLEKALEYNSKGIEMLRLLGNDLTICEHLIRKAEILTDLKKYDEALIATEEAIALSKKMNHNRSYEMVYSIQSRIFEELGDYENSLKYFKLYKTYDDSVTLARNVERYKNFEKQKEIDLQKIELENLSREEVRKTQQRNLAYGGISILALLGFLLVRRYYLNIQLNNELVSQNSLIEAQKVKLSQALEDKTVLLREIHHRVKNNLQIISSLLNLQSKKIKDESVLSSINEGRNRVQAMSLIHQNLYQTDNLTSLDMESYFTQLMANLSRSLNMPDKQVKCEISVDNVHLDIDTAIPIGLVVNELVSNAYEHAFIDQDNGEIGINLREKEDENYELIVSDNGKGMPEGFDISKSKSLGLRLVYALGVRQLNGKLQFHNDTINRVILEFSNP